MTASLPVLAWIRFEPHKRFHAVYADAWGGYWTFCNRFTRGEALRERTNVEPPARSQLQDAIDGELHPGASACVVKYIIPKKRDSSI